MNKARVLLTAGAWLLLTIATVRAENWVDNQLGALVDVDSIRTDEGVTFFKYKSRSGSIVKPILAAVDCQNNIYYYDFKGADWKSRGFHVAPPRTGGYLQLKFVCGYLR